LKPVFANSAWVGAPERLILRNGRWRRRQLRVRYGLFVHPVIGPTLIDTGYTDHALNAAGRSRGLRIYSRALAPRLVPQEQSKVFLGQFGLSERDITTVIVTHFHADHASGLAAFPHARFIASLTTWKHLREHGPFRHLRHGVFRELVPTDFGQRLNSIEEARTIAIPDLQQGHDILGDGSVLAVPLPGHAVGHFGLLFPRLQVPLLYATDTQWVADALPTSGRPGLLPRMISDSYHDFVRSSDRVEAFRQSGGTVLLCHDDIPSPYDFAEGGHP
jgi:glyoxylase-like metal-dependent hydrolase (beta-lactamase superfamily II)